MTHKLTWLTLIMAAAFAIPARLFADSSFLILSYHEVKNSVVVNPEGDLTEVSRDRLEEHFQWLKDNGYTVVSFEQIAKATKKGGAPLPEKSVLLTFDDGYRDFYDNAFPLLQKFNYPAVLALVGSWMELAPSEPVPLDPSRHLTRADLLTWDMVREVSKSGLIEIASHSFDLHRGILGNPQGNLQPSAVTRLFDQKTQTYESDKAYARRMRKEMRAASDIILKETGKRPRIMVWPYGEYNDLLVKFAAQMGMPNTMGLIEGLNTAADLPQMKRMLITENPKVADFAQVITGLRKDRPIRSAHVDIDSIYDADPVQLGKNLDALIERIHQMRINTVYLQAFADPDGDGNADALYFPNRKLPMRADLFNRISWQLHTRTRVKVYAWLPVLAFVSKELPEKLYVQEWKDGKVQSSKHVYKRLSPWRPETLKFVKEIYEDLGKYSNFAGLLYHDDALLTDFEDASPEALRYAKKHWSLPDNVETLRSTPALRRAWGERKAQFLNDFTKELTAAVKVYRPDMVTARNIYALPLLNENSVEWYAQDYAACLRDYDYVAVEAMPFMEKAKDPDEWLQALMGKLAEHPDGLRKTVVELQTVDWNTEREIPMDTFLHQLDLVTRAGAVNLAYYPDKVYSDQPVLRDLRKVFSAPWKP